MTKTQMRKAAGISTNILAKMGKDEPVSMDSLAKVCVALDCTLDDIVEITTKAIKPFCEENEQSYEFTEKQWLGCSEEENK